MAWDEVRREAEYRIRLAGANAVARAKNTMLPDLQEQFEDAVDRGELLGSITVDSLVESMEREILAALN